MKKIRIKNIDVSSEDVGMLNILDKLNQKDSSSVIAYIQNARREIKSGCKEEVKQLKEDIRKIINDTAKLHCDKHGLINYFKGRDLKRIHNNIEKKIKERFRFCVG